MKQDYRDRNGLAIADLVLSLPPCTAYWPNPPRRTGGNAQAEFHAEFAGTVCWYCEERVGRQCHHFAAGSRGRAHERPLLFWACEECHANSVGVGDMPRWLRGKHKYDPDGTDWLWLTIRLGYFLPDLTTRTLTRGMG